MNISCVALFLSGSLAAAQEIGEPAFPQALIQRVLDAESADARQEATRALFHGAPEVDVRDLATHSNDQISLAAAWETIRQTLADEPDVDREGWSVSQPLGAHHVERFLGVLEGRLRVRPPEWWEKRFVLAEAVGKDIITYPQSFLAAPYEPVTGDHPVNPGLLLPKGDRLEAEDDRVLFVSGVEDIGLPDRVAVRLKEPSVGTVVTGVVHDGVLFIAAHDRIPDEYELYAVSIKRGEVRWTSTVWSGFKAVRGYSGGGHVHWTWIQVSDGVVYIFGDAGHWLYVEGFHVSDGKPVLRWATSY